jgi:PTS system nitrogen regulatory IIA component
MLDSTANAGSRFMTLAEMADYLKIGRKTLLAMAQRGEIPATKVSSQWRFMRSLVDDWLMSRMRSLPERELERLIQSDRLPIPLPRLIPPELVRLDIQDGPKRRILAQLVEPLERAGLLREPQQLVDRLMEREEMVSTAIFPGIAIPHARRPEECRLAEPRIVLGVSCAGVEYDSLDGRPTFAFFLICTGQTVVHLKVMAELTLLFRRPGLLRALRAAGDATAALKALFPLPGNQAAIDRGDASH